MTRGLREITRLGVKMGADPLTFLGLAGMGDLVLTCTGDLSRNRRVGLELGRGRKLAEIVAGMSEVAEGVRTTHAACALADAERRRDADRPERAARCSRARWTRKRAWSSCSAASSAARTNREHVRILLARIDSPAAVWII